MSTKSFNVRPSKPLPADELGHSAGKPELGKPSLSVNPTPQPADGEEKASDGENTTKKD